MRLETDGFEFCLDFMAKLIQRNVDIHVVPISYSPRYKKEEEIPSGTMGRLQFEL